MTDIKWPVDPATLFHRPFYYAQIALSPLPLNDHPLCIGVVKLLRRRVVDENLAGFNDIVPAA